MKPYKLNEDWRINTDPHNFILEKSRIIKSDESENKGKTQWDQIGFYSTTSALLSGLCKKVVLSSDKNIKALIDELRDIKELGKELDKKLGV